MTTELGRRKPPMTRLGRPLGLLPRSGGGPAQAARGVLGQLWRLNSASVPGRGRATANRSWSFMLSLVTDHMSSLALSRPVTGVPGLHYVVPSDRPHAGRWLHVVPGHRYIYVRLPTRPSVKLGACLMKAGSS